MDIVLQIAIGLLVIGIGVLAGRTWERIRVLRRYGHVRALLGKYDRIQVIVSRVEVQRFKFADGSVSTSLQVPPNVLYMPMPEGRAIAELMRLLHRINGRVKVELVTAAENCNLEIPVISIGGPSVNAFTGKVLAEEFPGFVIEYPATRRAHYEGHIFEAFRDANNYITQDHGFVFLTQTAKNAPCLNLLRNPSFRNSYGRGAF